MASRFYQNFDLLIEAHEDGSYRTRVTNSPLGESPSAAFWLPFEPTQLENLMLRLDPGRSGTRRITGDPQARAALELGGKLFESVFSEDIMLVWSRSQDITRAAGSGLRIRLRLTDAPAIAGLPWELLYDRRRDASQARVPVSPGVDVWGRPTPRWRVERDVSDTYSVCGGRSGIPNRPHRGFDEHNGFLARVIPYHLTFIATMYWCCWCSAHPRRWEDLLTVWIVDVDLRSTPTSSETLY